MLTLAFIRRHRAGTERERVEDDRSAYSAATPKLRKFFRRAIWGARLHFRKAAIAERQLRAETGAGTASPFLALCRKYPMRPLPTEAEGRAESLGNLA
jgi:hypothetical protein